MFERVTDNKICSVSLPLRRLMVTENVCLNISEREEDTRNKTP